MVFSQIKDLLSNWIERLFIVKPILLLNGIEKHLRFTGDGRVNQREENQRYAGERSI